MMEILNLELLNEPNQEFNVILEDKNCTIGLRQLGQSVFFSLSADGETIVSNQICNDRVPMPTFNTSKFKGKFVFIDLLGNEHPVYTEFNDRYSFNYVNFSDE